MERLLKHLGAFLVFIVLSLIIHQAINSLNGQEYRIAFISIKSIFNTAFIFGLFNESSHFVRIVFTSVFFGLISVIACYFYAFLAREIRTLRWGMTILMMGLAGNSFEKLVHGFVRDYISLQIGFLDQIYFNLNDVLQIIGLIIIVREVFSKHHMIWFPHETKRKRILVYKEIQLPMMTKILGLFLIGSLTQGILAIALLFPQLKRGTQDLQLIFILCLFILNLFLLPMIGRFFLRELLRCMGPIYALEKHLRSEEPLQKPIKFRSTDHFKSLEEAFNQFVSKYFKP